MNEAGIDDSAILLLSLGEEEAAQVLRHLSPKEVQKIGHAMTRLKGVTHDRIDGVLTEFHSLAEQQSPLGMNSDSYVRTVVTRALGDDKAGYLLDRILQGGDASGIESLKWMDAATVAELIRNEHPQIIASILAHLERDHAAEIAALFPDALRNDVIVRIATLDGIQPAALRDLNEVLATLLSTTESVKKSPLGGVRTAAEILNRLGSTVETAAIEALRSHDGELAERIVDEMFVFENLLQIDDRGIQALLREVQSESLIVALKGASQELRDKIFKNMSQRAAEMLRDDLEAKGPVRVAEVEAEQKEILKVLRRMGDEGQVVIGGKGDGFL